MPGPCSHTGRHEPASSLLSVTSGCSTIVWPSSSINRRLPLPAIRISLRQLSLELLVEQLVPVQAQEHEQLRPPHRLDHRLLRRRWLRRRPPHIRTHRTTSLVVANPSLPATNKEIAHTTTASQHHDETRPHYLTGALAQGRRR